jgi:TetR/AcrR family transcriptional repressor of nem operon
MTRPHDRGANADTSVRILDVAERLIQTRGFNGFSYADIANELLITKASLHYHFATKAALGVTLLDRYTSQFAAALQQISERRGGAREQLRRYVAIYSDVLRGDRMCLCGMLAAEYTTLPEPMQHSVRKFFDTNERWLAKVLGSGRRSGELEFHGSPAKVAQGLIGGLEGAMLIARPYGDLARFRAAARGLLNALARDSTTMGTAPAI